MKKTYSFICKTSNIKFSIITNFRQNKVLYLILGFFALLGLLTGVFVACKCGVSLATLTDYNLDIYSCENFASFAPFGQRFLSCFCVLMIFILISFSVFLLPIGFVLVGYRCYLVGFNCALLVCLFGITGALNSIIIILPCQLALTVLFSVFFVLMVNCLQQKKRFGRCENSKIKLFFIFFLLCILICIIETFLTILFSVSTILVL